MVKAAHQQGFDDGQLKVASAQTIAVYTTKQHAFQQGQPTFTVNSLACVLHGPHSLHN